jgi:hypothetical protein
MCISKNALHVGLEPTASRLEVWRATIAPVERDFDPQGQKLMESQFKKIRFFEYSCI